MKYGSLIRRRKSFVHYQLNLSFELALQLMVYVRIHVHQVFANWSDTNRLYRIRVGRYRIVYEIDDKAQQVLITRIRHRREVYR